MANGVRERERADAKWFLTVRKSQWMQKNEAQCFIFHKSTHKTIMFHEFAPNMVNMHFPTQDQSFGTIYPCTSVLNQITRFKNIL